jgi:hypothetical protein
VGSRPPEVDNLWKVLPTKGIRPKIFDRQGGREKGVDHDLVAEMIEASIREEKTDGVIASVAGDGVIGPRSIDSTPKGGRWKSISGVAAARPSLRTHLGTSTWTLIFVSSASWRRFGSYAMVAVLSPRTASVFQVFCEPWLRNGADRGSRTNRRNRLHAPTPTVRITPSLCIPS